LRFKQIFKIQIYSIGKKRLLVKVSLSLPFFLPVAHPNHRKGKMFLLFKQHKILREQKVQSEKREQARYLNFSFEGFKKGKCEKREKLLRVRMMKS
jgi:hypothetical protein